ncbi:MAG: hypothetical protein U1E20_08310 [Methylocystis sp.]|uniref:hypothetical protein n=1 Tax=Methylocystis sp. TaxID=1911079 RepID=UPI0039397439
MFYDRANIASRQFTNSVEESLDAIPALGPSQRVNVDRYATMKSRARLKSDHREGKINAQRRIVGASAAAIRSPRRAKSWTPQLVQTMFRRKRVDQRRSVL